MLEKFWLFLKNIYERYKPIIVGLIFILLLVLIAYLATFLPIKENSEITKKLVFLSKLALSVGVIVAAFQFYLNKEQLEQTNEWNKKQLAITEVNKINEKLEKKIQKLMKILNYGERKEPYKISEIHCCMGKFKENCKDFEFHNKDSGTKNTDGIKNLCLEYDGQDVKNTIINLLNDFEYIATGVNMDIFDENVVKKLWRGKLIYAFDMFKNYIHHLRIEHGWENVYTELEYLANKWKKEKEDYTGGHSL